MTKLYTKWPLYALGETVSTDTIKEVEVLEFVGEWHCKIKVNGVITEIKWVLLHKNLDTINSKFDHISLQELQDLLK